MCVMCLLLHTWGQMRHKLGVEKAYSRSNSVIASIAMWNVMSKTRQLDDGASKDATSKAVT